MIPVMLSALAATGVLEMRELGSEIVKPASVIAQAQAQEVPTLSIDQAVEIAQQNAFAIRTAKSNLSKARQLVDQSRSVYFPTLTATANYSKFTPGSFSSSGSGSFAPLESESGSSASIPDESKTAGVSIGFPIDISGGIRAGVSSAKFNQEARTAFLDAEKLATQSSVRLAYYSLLQAEAAVGVQVDELAAAKERLDKARLRLEAGDLAAFDVLRLDADSKRSEQALFAAQTNVVLAKQSLNNLLGRPIETEFRTVQVEGLPTIESSEAELVAGALKQRPEMRALDNTVKSLDRIRRFEETGSMPSLGVNGSYTRVIDAPQGSKEDLLSAGIGLRWPVWDGGITRARVASAREDVVQAQIQQEQVALGIALEVRSTMTQFANARRVYDVAVANREVAQEALRLAQLRFDEGAGILLDVIDSQAVLTAARVGEISARYQVLAAYAALQRAVGSDALTVTSP